MTDAVNTTTPRTQWGRATVGPYTLLITPEAIAVSVPNVVGNDLRPKLYRATLTELEHGYPDSGVLSRFLTESSRCCLSTIHHDEGGQRWINVFLHIGNLESAGMDIHGEHQNECLTINVMKASDSWLDLIETSELLSGVPLTLMPIA